MGPDRVPGIMVCDGGGDRDAGGLFSGGQSRNAELPFACWARAMSTVLRADRAAWTPQLREPSAAAAGWPYGLGPAVTWAKMAVRLEPRLREP